MRKLLCNLLTYVFLIAHTWAEEFDPLSIPDCQIYLKDSIGIEAEEGFVKTWTNQAQDKYHATQDRKERRPTHSFETWPGHTTIDSNKYKEFLILKGTQSLSAGQGMSVYIVNKSSNIKNNASLIGNFIPGKKCSGWKLSISKINKVLFFTGTPEREKTGAGNYEQGKTIAIATHYSGNQVTIHNSKEKKTFSKKFNNPTIQNTVPLLLGAEYKNEKVARTFAHNEFALVLVYNRTLDTEEHSKIWNWLNETYPDAFDTGFKVEESNSSKELAANSSLTIKFSEKLSPDTTFPKVFINSLNEDTIEGSWSISEGNTISFKPASPFPKGSLIVVDLQASVTSTSGKKYDKPTNRYLSYIVDNNKMFESSVTTIESLKKTNGGAHNIPLTIRVPKVASEKTPILFWVHGGGWSGGSESQSYASEGQYANYLSNKLGIAVIGTAYRCKGSSGNFNQAMEDVMDAVQWARDNAETYNLDLSRMGFAGGSAGTPIASLVAHKTAESVLYVGFNGIYNFLENPNSSFGGGNAYGQQTPTPQNNSAIFNIKKNPPYTVLLHGSHDTTINPQQSVLFHEATQKAGGESKVIIYQNEAHAFFNKGKQMEIPCLYEFKEAAIKAFKL